jgi:hypothetical protein
VFAEARQQAAVAPYLAPVSAAGTPVRRSLEAGGKPSTAVHGQQKAPQRTRRRLLSLADEPKQQADDDTASSSGDDAMHSSYAALARRLRRGADGTGGVSKSRWGGRLVVLAGIRMVHVMLAASSRR